MIGEKSPFYWMWRRGWDYEQMQQLGVPHKFIYGAADDSTAVGKIASYARTARGVRRSLAAGAGS